MHEAVSDKKKFLKNIYINFENCLFENVSLKLFKVISKTSFLISYIFFSNFYFFVYQKAKTATD